MPRSSADRKFLGVKRTPHPTAHRLAPAREPRDPDSRHLAVQVSLLRFPCPFPETQGRPNRRSALAHASPALASVWAELAAPVGGGLPGASSGAEEEGVVLVTAGGHDLTLLQWAVRPAPASPLAAL